MGSNSSKIRVTFTKAAKLMKGQIQRLLGSIAAKQNAFMEQLGTLAIGSVGWDGGVGIMRPTGQVSHSLHLQLAEDNAQERGSVALGVNL